MHDKQVKMDNDMAQMSYNLNHMFDNNPFFNKQHSKKHDDSTFMQRASNTVNGWGQKVKHMFSYPTSEQL